jgi:hypothetical protein
MSDSYNRLLAMSNDRIDKQNTTDAKSNPDYNGLLYILLITFFILFILSLF